MTDVNILLASAGRRPYLVRWFREAADRLGISAKVILADADKLAPALGICDRFVQAPAVSELGYPQWLESTLREHDISLALSVNDFELSRWAQLPMSEGFDSLLRLDPETHKAVEDKLAMDSFLSGQGILTPETYLVETALSGNERARHFESHVIKGRFGSGSRGFRDLGYESLESAVAQASSAVTTRTGSYARDTEHAAQLIVIQQKVRGKEFGLDVIADLQGNYVGVLAREKLSMRAGETDKACSVDPASFSELGSQLTEALRHRGSVDVDVIVDGKGQPWVIDINPRLGGGYPFNHLAGADLPGTYLSWLDAGADARHHLSYTTGVVAAKYVETAVVEATHGS